MVQGHVRGHRCISGRGRYAASKSHPRETSTLFHPGMDMHDSASFITGQEVSRSSDPSFIVLMDP